ncbi:MAG: sigma-70 family RNA polymerase sigma factor [Victivallales bacterium]|nr:sigma-70 family RNA polymerase sigma factor [Victivallales bacterium]
MKKPERDKLERFEQLVMENHRQILAFAFSLTSDIHAAKDIAQEAFLTAFKKVDSYDSGRSFAVWVRGIVRRKYLEWVRASRGKVLTSELIDLIEARHRNWEENVLTAGKDLFYLLNKCLEKLDEEQKRIVNMFYFQRRSGREIAAAVNLNEATVRKRLERIRTALKDCIEDNLLNQNSRM